MPDELKPCPVMISAQHMKSAYCIGKDCAWWSEAAEMCSIAAISEEVWKLRVGEGEKG